jgi:hydrogenase small subunit
VGAGDSSKIGKNSCISAADQSGAYTAFDLVKALAKKAGAVLATGTCASYGGIPAATNRNYDPKTGRYKNNGAMSVSDAMTGQGITAPIVKIPNCPVNPLAFYLTVAAYLTSTLNLTSDNRPTEFNAGGVRVPLYTETIHGGKCPRYNNYNGGVYANKFGDTGCLYWRGCQGMNTVAPCGQLGGIWNDFAAQFCIKGGAPCTGCASEGYPDKFSPLATYTTAGY